MTWPLGQPAARGGRPPRISLALLTPEEAESAAAWAPAAAPRRSRSSSRLPAVEHPRRAPGGRLR
ncbi:MAG: hypothetical protein WKG07_05500 [Hymenobacter sp.]